MFPNVNKQSSRSSLFLFTLLTLLLDPSSATPIAERSIDYVDDASETNSKEHKDAMQMVIVVGVIALVIGVALAGWYSIEWFMRTRNEKIRKSSIASTTPLETIDLTPPPPASRVKSRSSDTWERYLSMIQSPTRLNQAVNSMKSQNGGGGRWNKIKEEEGRK